MIRSRRFPGWTAAWPPERSVSFTKTSRFGIRSATTRDLRNWSPNWSCQKQRQHSESRKLLRRAEAAQRLQSCSRVCNRRLARDTNRHAGFSISGNSKLGCEVSNRGRCHRIPNRTHYCVGVRAHTRRTKANGGCRPCSFGTPTTKTCLDFCRGGWSCTLGWFVFYWSLHGSEYCQRGS